jgi:hypothetical protein
LQPARSQCQIAYFQANVDCIVTHATDSAALAQCRQEAEVALQKCLEPIEAEAQQAELDYQQCLQRCATEAARCRLPDHEPPANDPPQPPRDHSVPDLPPNPPPPGPGPETTA